MFRFESLDIWRKAIETAEKLLDVADELEGKKLFRFAEQLRAAALSMPNNIAEGSGSGSKGEFGRFIGYARCSAFENANMIIIFARRNYIDTSRKDELLAELDRLCCMLTSFRRSLSS